MSQERPEGPLRVLVGMPLAGRDGGSERLLETLLRHAGVAGADFHLVLFERGALADGARRAGARVTCLEVARHNDPLLAVATIARLRRLIRSERPDVVLSWLARAHTWLGPAAALAGRRQSCAWWQHHIARGERLELLMPLLPAAAVIATSAAAARAQAARRPRRPCPVVHPGIERPPSSPAAELQRTRERLGIAGEGSVVAIAGRLVRWKRQHAAIEALAALRAGGVDATLLVVGGTAYGLDTDYPSELRGLARSLGVADRVIFTGPVADPFPYIELADVLLNASDGEPFGLTLVEAMALGTPVVAVDRAGPAEIVEHGRSGLLAPDPLPASLAAAIASLLGDAGLRDRLARGGQVRYETRFTAELMAARTGSVLRTVASGGAWAALEWGRG